MIVFEIYFFFNFIVQIEKEEFLKNIQSYLNQLNSLELNEYQKTLINIVITEHLNNKYYLALHENYINSLEEQEKKLNQLLNKACGMASIVGLILLLLLFSSLINIKKIKWNWIVVENILMFVFLGIFEYFFFVTIILKYAPITDDEIRYYVADEIIKYFNTTT
jgi:hypothetical protein